MLRSRLFLKERRLTLLVLLTNLGIGRAKVVDTAHVDLPRRVLSQVVHDVISDIINSSIATQRNSANRVDSNMVKQSNRNRLADILKYLLSERRTVRISIDLRIGICHRCLLLNIALSLD